MGYSYPPWSYFLHLGLCNIIYADIYLHSTSWDAFSSGSQSPRCGRFLSAHSVVSKASLIAEFATVFIDC